MRNAQHAEVGRHKCLIYDGAPAEQLPVVVPLLKERLSDNWRCLYLGSPNDVRMVEGALAQEGIDTRREQERNALVLSSSRDHLVGGRFDPGAMIDMLRTTVEAAVRDGHRGLWATGDMRWELGEDESFAMLVEYEARLDVLIREMPLRGLCQYPRGLVPPEAIERALASHRLAYLGHTLNHENVYYVPPEILLATGDPGKRGEWMCQQILRVTKAERERDELMLDLERRVAERTAELAVANRHLRAFSYSVSHDLKAPLRAIMGFGGALAEDSGDRLDDRGKENLEIVLDSARRMRDLIDGMLVLGRVVESDMQRVEVDLSALACSVVAELRTADRTREVEIDVEDGLAATGDPILLRALLTNLVGNAWKFTSKRAAPRIVVGKDETPEGVVFFVRDNGAGFSMDHAPQLFGLFKRLHTQEEFAGTGVGLATVERIVSRHGGRIWAEGRVGEGATFFFTLPTRGARDSLVPAAGAPLR